MDYINLCKVCEKNITEERIAEAQTLKQPLMCIHTWRDSIEREKYSPNNIDVRKNKTNSK